jgi:hypothetical protein
MRIVASIAGIVVILGVLLDAFETVVLPRRVSRQFRLTTWFYRHTWVPWARIGQRIQSRTRRESFFGYFGPLSLIFLLALWAVGLIFGFALLQYANGEHLSLVGTKINFWILLYHSGETFFTLGYGDITPNSTSARLLAVMEAGMGFAFLGVVIGYLPTIYSTFSRREIEISLLDARAGSPPTAAELLSRLATTSQQLVLNRLLVEWERWAAEILESHLSYPPLSFFRSQHSNQSWLGALITILDASALILVGVDNIPKEQAKLTFAMARHAVVDLAQVVDAHYDRLAPDRLPPEDLRSLRQYMAERGAVLREGVEADQKLEQVRSLYEPYAQAIARNLFIDLPPWLFPDKKKDNWQSGPWDRAIQAKGLGKPVQVIDDHF